MELKEVREVRYRFRQAALDAGFDPDTLERDMWQKAFKHLTGTECYADIRKNGVIAFVVSPKDQGSLMGGLQRLSEMMEAKGIDN